MSETELDSRDRTATAKYFGKYPGLVLKNGAPDDGSDHRGELLVEIPGILEEAPDGSGQRPIQVVARPCFMPGFFFIPEVKAQVWVEFVAGDINAPLWTGVWYPTSATPQTPDSKSPTEFQKVIHTAANHVILLDDSSDAATIVIRHKSGSTIEIDNKGNITITDKGGDTSIVSQKISLGTKGGSSQQIVLGNKLNDFLKQLIDDISMFAKTHVHPTTTGASGPAPSATAFEIKCLKYKNSLDKHLSNNTTE